MLEKAAGLAADELILDLEDAVAPGSKEQARHEVLKRLADWDGPRVTVRINAPRTPWCHRDLIGLAETDAPELRSVVVPKVENVGDLEFAERLLSGAEAESGRKEHPLGIQALIETASGLAQVEEIARSGGRLETLILGYADLAASLGRPRDATSDPNSFRFAQDRVLTAAKASGLQAIDGPFLGIHADERFRAAVAHARELGFDGKWAIHPSQISSLNEVFTPGAEEVAWAKGVLNALADAERDGGSGAVALEGEMLDEAVAVSARRLLARADEVES
jgi:citrate lyase subunit beta/citryl-CoA lyase